MATLYVFPDTNLLMHFRRLDELDWKGLSGAKEIVVVLAPAVVRELGKHKDSHPSRKLRQRARKLNSWLRELRTDQIKRFKNGVTLEVATKEPVAFLTDDLDPGTPDDRIIASALAYAADKHDVAIATDDTILLHKLDAHGIRAIEVPEELRLAEEADEVEIENKGLRKELAAIKNRQPDLDLVWQAGGLREAHIVVVPANLPDVLPPHEMEAKHPKLRKRGDASASRYGVLANMGASILGMTDEMVDSYNMKLLTFRRQYETYYTKVQTIADLRRRSVALGLRLKNVGHASATHIQITARLPDGMAFLREQPSTSFPPAPKPPPQPSTLGLLNRPLELSPEMFRGRAYSPAALPIFDPFAAEIDDAGTTVQWQRTRLLHETEDDFDLVHCIFNEDLIGRTVQVQVELRAEEISSARRFNLDLHISKKPDD